MSQPRRIYLDNAATSWPKPQAVYDAVDDYQRRLGAAVGRGGYAEAAEVGREVDEARAAVARVIGAEGPERIIFTFNGTDSLNLAIHGTLRPGDHVITTVAEHNSVLRPLRRLEKRGRNEVTRIGCGATGVINPDDIRAALRPETKLIILTHASNVTGAIQPAAEVGRIAREHGALFLVDAAQTLGHLPLSVAELGADLLAAPGHKGLLGPLGTGVLYVRPGIEDLLDTTREGGTGSASSSDEQPTALPQKYESGNHNAPGIVGLGAGVRYVEQRGVADIRRHAVALTELLLQGLSDVPGIRIFGPQQAEKQIGVVSFAIEDRDPLELAQTLDEVYRIQARAGFQCAALMHRCLGTLDSNGTVRFSVGPFNSEEDVRTAVQAVAGMAKSQPTAVTPVPCPCVDADAQPAGMVMAATAVTAGSERMNIADIPGLHDLWNHTRGDPEIRIAILDGPVDCSHPSLKKARLTQVGNQGLASSAGPAAYHGTHVASVIFGQHDGPIPGIAPNCTGLVRPIFADGKDGSIQPCTQSGLAAAIRDAIDARAHIINISGGEPASGSIDPALLQAVKKCEQAGVLIVAAAGNRGCAGLDSCACVHVPGALPSVLAVGAMNARGEPLGFSNCGETYQTQGVLALGENILGAIPGGQTATYTGTSFATPIVSGIAALLMSIQRIRGRPAHAAAVRSVLLSSVDGCEPQRDSDCRRILKGRLNIKKALQMFPNHNGENLMSSTDYRQPESNASPSPAPNSSGCGCLPHQDDADCDSGTCSNPSLNSTAPADWERQQVATAGAPVGVAANEPRMRPSSAVPAVARTTGNGKQVSQPVERVAPSACLAARPGDLVYVIGELQPELTTDTTLKSIQQAVVQKGIQLNVHNTYDLLAYLLGYRVKPKQAKHDDASTVCGNMNDATFVQWIITQDDCPKYVVRPEGPYAEAAYLEIIRFLIDQLGIKSIAPSGVPAELQWESSRSNHFDIQLRGDCLQGYFSCHGGDTCPEEAFKPTRQDLTKILRQAPPPAAYGQQQAVPAAEDYADVSAIVEDAGGRRIGAATRVAFAGEICGVTVLRNGKQVPVINPALRSTANWNMEALIEKLNSTLVAPPPAGRGHLLTLDELILLQNVLLSLADSARNDGQTPEERALNYALTAFAALFADLILNPVFERLAGTLLELGFDGATVRLSDCQRPDALLYDVELAFYNQARLVPSRVVVAFVVNVAEINPHLDSHRIFTRR